MKNQKSKISLEAKAIEKIINEETKKAIPDKIILCFDDLERINPNFFESAMGFINSFIEHYNTKTIFICNENKLENTIPKYREIKEKYIRFTYIFNSQIDKVLDYKLDKKYIENKSYFDKGVIIDVFRRGRTDNIRILFFVLDIYNEVVNCFNGNVDIKSNNDLLQLLLHYVCFYSIEKKQRGTDSDTLKRISISFLFPSFQLVELSEIDSFNPFDDDVNQKVSEKDKIDDNEALKDIQRKYFSKGHYPFERFLSIADYIDNGFLDEEKLKNEIKKIGEDLSSKTIINTQNRLIEGLSDYNLTNDSFLPFIEEVFAEVDKAEFYLKLYSQLVWLESLRGLSESLSLPVSTGNLIRFIHNSTQTKRSKTQRWENVKDIFDVKNTAAFEGKHLLLVDDVITTSSTLEACACALQKCPSVKISIATLGGVF